MIIECPACVTRYDIKAELPPEGRTVRCAKCGSVWRALPLNDGATEAEEQAAAPAALAPSHHDEAAIEQAFRHFAAEGYAAEEHAGEQSDNSAWSEAGHAHDDEWSMHVDSSFAAPEETGSAKVASLLEDSLEPEAEPEPDASEEQEESRDSGKVRWFHAFRRKRNRRTKPGRQAHPLRRRPPKRSRSLAPSPKCWTQRTCARWKKRGWRFEAFLPVSAMAARLPPPRLAESERDDIPAARAEPQLENAWAGAAEEDETRAEEAPSPGWTAGDADAADRDEAETPVWQGSNGNAENAAMAVHAQAAEEASDPETALRNAMRAHFASASKGASIPSQPSNDDLSRNLETHFRSTPAPAERTEAASVAGLWGKTYGPASEERIEPELVEEHAGGGDDDAAFDHRLFREIEETREKSGEVKRRKGRGGLALAAAWGLFLCVAAGLAVGFFAFRDIVADALPGVAPLYRTLGMPITVQPLVFESVQYEWKVSDNKPVLVVSGSVFNRAQRKVRIPQFFITIKDQNPSLDREYSASLRVRGSKLSSNQGADFDIELMTPNPTLTSVELELRNVR